MAPRRPNNMYIPFPSDDPAAARAWLQDPANATFDYLREARHTIAKDYKALFSDLRLVVQCKPRRIFDSYSTACEIVLRLSPAVLPLDLEQLSGSQISEVANRASEDILRVETSSLLPWTGQSRGWIIKAMHAGVLRGIHSWMCKKKRLHYQGRLSSGDAASGRGAGLSSPNGDVEAGVEHGGDDETDEEEPTELTVLSSAEDANGASNFIRKRKAATELDSQRNGPGVSEAASSDVDRLILLDKRNWKQQKTERTKVLLENIARLHQSAEDFRKAQQKREEEFAREQDRKMVKYLQELRQSTDCIAGTDGEDGKEVSRDAD